MTRTVSANRVYLVTEISTGAERLVRANYRASALRHAAQEKFTAHKATHDDLERLITAGVRVETATDNPAPEPADDVSEQLP
jgi:hypothetical protein